MAKKIALIPASIDALQKGLLADLLTPGLAIEVFASGKKRWRYHRQVAGKDIVATLYGKLFPAQTIAAAREWARGLNEKVEAGIDSREALREEKARASMTVARAHELLPWIELVEDWSDVADLTAQDRMRIRTAAAGMGSVSGAAALERDLLAIVDFDDPRLARRR